MEKRIVEINGVKLEVDLTEARVVESYKVGDVVKVLIKSYSDYKSYPGTIIGFDNFKNLPTILIAYLETSYNAASIKFVHLNAESKEIEVCPMNRKELPFAKENVLELMDIEINTTQLKVEDLKRKREFFLAEFGSYFKESVVNS